MKEIKEWMRREWAKIHKVSHAESCVKFVEEYHRRRNNREFDHRWAEMDKWAWELLSQRKGR